MKPPDVSPPRSPAPAAARDYRAASPLRRNRSSRWLLYVVITLVFAGIVGFALYRSRVAAASKINPRRLMRGRATPVAITPATKGDLPVFLNALGTVTPLNTVTVRSRADGQLEKIHFTDGQSVHAGDLLAEIDPRAYQASLDQATGQLARDRALLENARRDLERFENAHEAVTQQQVDTAKATVAQYEGVVRADEATVERDQLQLSYCRITAPIDGIAGLRLVDQGNLVRASDSTGIVVITQEQPITVMFSIPEQNLPEVRQALLHGVNLRVEAYDRAMQNLLATGELTAIDNQIDATTGTVRIKSLFPNSDRELYPNQFVNVRLLVKTLHDATLIPSSAIQINAQQRFVFVVKPDETVERRTVRILRTEGELTAIAEGLAPGENIVTEGLDRLEDGTRVTPRPPDAGEPSRPAAADTNAPAAPGGPKHARRPRQAGAGS